MKIPRPDLLFVNCRVLTMDDQHPVAESVAITGDRITWVGSDRDSEGLVSGANRVINGLGRTLIPGFHDAHIHFLAYAASFQAVDCRPSSVSSILDIKNSIEDRAKSTMPGQWIRAVGYSEFDLLEGRHPTRWELDQAAADNPVRLIHRSGHACVLNSRALDLAGITDSTPEPPGSTILRDLNTGAPNGVLLEMDDFLEGKIPAPTIQELASDVAEASQALASLGITALQDATPSNSISRWETFGALKSDDTLSQRVTFMIGGESTTKFLRSGAGRDSKDMNLRIGAAKLMVTKTSGSLFPDLTAIHETVRKLDNKGFQVAIHAVEFEAVSAGAEAIAWTRTSGSQLRHRLEHCSEMPPVTLEQVVASGAIVVTQPGFVYASGRRYLAETAAADHPWLYRIGGLRKAGTRLAFGSDAPVIDPNPMLGIYSAVSRKSQDGNVVAFDESINLHDALEAYTLGSAFAGRMESHLGAIKPGLLADMVLLDRDVTTIEQAELTEIQVNNTVIGGAMAWDIEDQ